MSRGTKPTLKTEVIYYVDYVEDLNAALPEWKIHDVKKVAAVCTVTARSVTLGVAVGPRQFIAGQLLAMAEAIRAMHSPTGKSGVSRVNHILRVHGHTILQERRAVEIYDEVGQRSV